MRNGLGQVDIAGVFEGFDPCDFSLVRSPVHPPGLGRKLAIEIHIVRSAQTVPRRPNRRACALVPTLELGTIGDLPPPSLPAQEALSPRRLPQNRDATIRTRALEVPLSASEMTRLRHEPQRLLHCAKLEMHPAANQRRQVRSKNTRCCGSAGIRLRPGHDGAHLASGTTAPRLISWLRLSLSPSSSRTRSRRRAIMSSI